MALGDIEIGTRLGEEVDEVGSDTDLASDVGELGGGPPEESVLLAHGLVDVAGGTGGHLSLVGHIGVGDLRDGSEEEDDCEDGDEACDSKVDVLDSLEGLAVGADMLEDDVGSKERSNDGTDSLDGLRQLETELRPFRRTADGNVGVGGDLECRQTRSSEEHGTAETTEASLDGRGPEHERTDAVDGETEDEGVAVSELAEEPTRVCQGTDEVGTKVGTLETRRLTLGNVKSDLETGVEHIEKTVGETPAEEEGGDQADGDDGLAGGEGTGTGDDAVVDTLAAASLVNDLDGRGTAALLLVDLI